MAGLTFASTASTGADAFAARAALAAARAVLAAFVSAWDATRAALSEATLKVVNLQPVPPDPQCSLFQLAYVLVWHPAAVLA